MNDLFVTQQDSSQLGFELRRYSCAELSKLGIPDYPGTEPGWRKLVERENWPFVEARGKGGRSGIKRLYQPPPAVQALIEARLQGALPPTVPRAAPRPVKHELPTGPGFAPNLVNVDALTEALLVHQQLLPGVAPRDVVRKAVEYYNYCVDRGLVTQDGIGEVPLKDAA